MLGLWAKVSANCTSTSATGFRVDVTQFGSVLIAAQPRNSKSSVVTEHQLAHFGAGLLDARTFETWLYEADNNDWVEQRIAPALFYTLLSTNYSDGSQQMAARDSARVAAMQINPVTWRDAMALATMCLTNEIEKAFFEVQRGSGTTLHEAEALDDRLSAAACTAARALDTETRWQDVPAAVISGQHPIGFLDNVGFVYYLPAYMSWCLRNRSDDSDSHPFTLYAICNADDHHGRYAHFTADQKSCVLNYIFFMAIHDSWDCRESTCLPKLRSENLMLYDKAIRKPVD